MITPERQLEIAKECGCDTFTHRLLEHPHSVMFNLKTLDAYAQAIEAEVIAGLEPVAQEFCKFYGVWMDDKEEESELEDGAKRILYRLPLAEANKSEAEQKEE